MNMLERIARYGAIAGFLLVSSGCVIAPDHYRDGRDHEDRNRDVRDHDERHCEDRDRDGRCHDRFR
jgi:hypothetical protein